MRYTLIITLFLFFSCSKKNDLNYGDFISANSAITKSGKEISLDGQDYSEFLMKNKIDSLKVYLGIKDDTLFALKYEGTCAKKFTFLPLRGLVHKSYYFSDYFCEDPKTTFNAVAGEILLMNKSADDNVYLFRHRTLSDIIYDMPYTDSISESFLASKIRIFGFSKRYGFVLFQTKINSAKDTLEFPF